MARISDTVKLKTDYANFIELESAFEATQENADRWPAFSSIIHDCDELLKRLGSITKTIKGKIRDS